MKDTKQVKALLISFFVLTVVIYILYTLNIEQNALYYTANTIYIASAFLSVVAAVIALKAYGKNARNFIPTLLFVIGIGCWTIGEVIWLVYLFMQIDPFPSIADLFYLLAYPFLFVSLLKFSDIRSKSVSITMKIMLFTLSILGGLYMLSQGMRVSYDEGGTTLSNVFAVSYPIGDIFLTVASVFAILTALHYKGGKMNEVFIAIFLGIFATLVGDFLFFFFNEEYLEGGVFILIDLLWVGSYLIFAYAFLLQVKMIRSLQQKVR